MTAQEVKNTLDYIVNKYGVTHQGGHAVQPGNTNTYTFNTTSVTSIGGGGGGGGTVYPLVDLEVKPDGTIYREGVKLVPEVKLNGQPMTPGDMERFLDGCVRRYKPGEMLLLVTSDASNPELALFVKQLDTRGVAAVVVCQPQVGEAVAVEPGAYHYTPADQIELLGRLAAIWESRTYLPFGKLLSLALEGLDMDRMDDNTIITALEKAYGQ